MEIPSGSNRVPPSESSRRRTWRARSRQLAASHRGNSTLHPRLQRLPGDDIDAAGTLPADALIVSEPGESKLALGGRKSCETILGHDAVNGGSLGKVQELDRVVVN